MHFVSVQFSQKCIYFCNSPKDSQIPAIHRRQDQSASGGRSFPRTFNGLDGHYGRDGHRERLVITRDHQYFYLAFLPQFRFARFCPSCPSRPSGPSTAKTMHLSPCPPREKIIFFGFPLLKNRNGRVCYTPQSFADNKSADFTLL